MADVFISYARQDMAQARHLFDVLHKKGIEAWLDIEMLLPGQKWQATIQEAIRACRYFIAILSRHSLSKKGYVQKELKVAFEILDEFPENEIFVIPVRIEDCDISDQRLKDLHYVDLFPVYEPGLSKLLVVLGRGTTDSPEISTETRFVQGNIKQEYEGAAHQFFGEIKNRIKQKKEVEKSQEEAEVTKSKLLSARIKEIEREAGSLVSSFKAAGAGDILTIQASIFPDNIFRETGTYRILVSFRDQMHWLVRFVTYPDRTLALQLVRVRGKEQASVHDNFMLTNDSINLVLSEDKFWISLNQAISKEIVTDIIGDLPRKNRSLDFFTSTVLELLRRTIERELILRVK
ncbi:MAG: toll/interleukin-1 receptor domain-containing protein [Desulfobacteraceae bacterium]|nr:toll/interleukin-1 receptor domain-containing protein [Desulfobacteraceae bacterium]